MTRKKKEPLIKRLAIVTWRDSYYDDQAHSEESLQRETKVELFHSAGFFIHETAEYVTLAMDWDGETCRHVQRIRRENIVDLKVIE